MQKYFILWKRQEGPTDRGNDGFGFQFDCILQDKEWSGSDSAGGLDAKERNREKRRQGFQGQGQASRTDPMIKVWGSYGNSCLAPLPLNLF
jgi:hypothetical protein